MIVPLICLLFAISTSDGACPEIADLPVQDNKRFIGALWWFELPYNGHVASLSCSGNGYSTVYSGQMKSSNTAFILTSLIVMPGCTFYGFPEPNYKGDPKFIEGPRLIKSVPTNYWKDCGGGKACVPSYIVECKQTFPDCTAETDWKVIAVLDNSASDTPASFVYKKTVGVTWSDSMTKSLLVSAEVSGEISEGIDGIFSDKLGFKVTTQAQIDHTSSKGGSTTSEIDVEVTVPAKRKVAYMQQIARCGGSTFNTQIIKVKNLKSGKGKGKGKARRSD